MSTCLSDKGTKMSQQYFQQYNYRSFFSGSWGLIRGTYLRMILDSFLELGAWWAELSLSTDHIINPGFLGKKNSMPMILFFLNFKIQIKLFIT